MKIGPQDTGWFKSSFSGGANDHCLEVRFTEGNPVAIRDSKNPTTDLAAPSAAWSHLIHSIR
ncbi:hypothetical protein JOD54_002212 [Actinokineospora baliensis]|uniref:DUF397 domain-containing protein n=1 Tax=Actinokineospora baliensis TaxID=547056 RepID=UPI00195B9EE2|nr:DUF397 domain-containing protein [Actinokineospora baliensis]MBM7772008.1 hypothetical protein [Actinokineospora baliensis]